MTIEGDKPDKGNETETTEDCAKSATPNLQPEEIFGTLSPTEQDGLISESGDFVLWLNEEENIYVERRGPNPISRRQYNYLKRLEERGIAQNLFRETSSRVEICVDRWIISDKRETGRDTNEVGEPEDLMPIIAEAL